MGGILDLAERFWSGDADPRAAVAAGAAGVLRKPAKRPHSGALAATGEARRVRAGRGIDAGMP